MHAISITFGKINHLLIGLEQDEVDLLREEKLLEIGGNAFDDRIYNEAYFTLCMLSKEGHCITPEDNEDLLGYATFTDEDLDFMFNEPVMLEEVIVDHTIFVFGVNIPRAPTMDIDRAIAYATTFMDHPW